MAILAEDAPGTAAPAPAADLSTLLIGLLKGVQYRDTDERQWATLLNLQPRVRDYVAVLGLDLVLDEAEGHAFLKSRPDPAEGDDAARRLPRLVARRALSFPVSLLLALLRKKLIEFDASGSETRLVLGRDDIVDLVRVFLPDSSNEARLIDQIDTTINKVVELGFLHRLKPAAGRATGPGNYEVRRILKAFVDAQWLAEFDARLAAYQAHLAGADGSAQESGDA
ncbi:DUF4194 domain-containing protein [Comamonadaceae bacterium G21597-S1]|nr:DUF4194 domain-containing protein [Comamonadaceae bacterium G21597-S1]